MAHSREYQLVSPDRLIKPDDKFREGFPFLDFREAYTFENTSGNVLITDPTYLADIYNSNDEKASFLRQHGVIVMNFGGDVSCPVWFQSPYLLVPIAMDAINSSRRNDIKVLAEEIGTDSGSFIFLPITDEIPAALVDTINGVVANKNGVLLHLPAGKWGVYYEQRETPQGGHPTFYRNIVARFE